MLKKYLFLFIATFAMLILSYNIPNFVYSSAKVCNTTNILKEDVYKTVSCRGEIETNNFTDISGKYVAKIQINENDIYLVKIGQKVIIKCNALGYKILYGKLANISDSAYKTVYSNMKTTVVDAFVQIDDHENDLLKTGYTLSADIIYDSIKKAKIVPYSALAQDDNAQYYVYLIDDGWAKKKYVSVEYECTNGVIVKNLNDDVKISDNPGIFNRQCERIKNETD